MSNSNEPTTYWQTLAAAADNGDLYLNPEAARSCHDACVAYILQLTDHRTTAYKLADCDGWGEFLSGQALRKIYSEKAVGGENSMVNVLDGHIAVVEEMKAVFQKFFVLTESQDHSNAADLGQSGPR